MPLRDLIPKLHHELAAYARAISQDPALAEDLVNDGIERALRAPEPPDRLENLRPWLFRIIRNLHLDELRKRRVRMEYAQAHVRLYGDDLSGRRDTEDALVRLAFEKLKPEQRELLFLVDVMGLRYAEAADVLAVPLGTIMSRVSRARQALLALVDDRKVIDFPQKKSKKAR